jgi:hypothetical protein
MPGTEVAPTGALSIRAKYCASLPGALNKIKASVNDNAGGQENAERSDSYVERKAVPWEIKRPSVRNAEDVQYNATKHTTD